MSAATDAGAKGETLRSVAVIVRLRWALTFAAMRRSAGQTVGYVVGGVMALAVVAWAGVTGWMIGSAPKPDSAAHAAEFGAVMVLAGSFLTVAVIMVQVLYLGQGSTLSPGRFALYGVPDRALSLGLLVAGLTGTPAICGFLSLLLWALAYRPFGAAAVAAQIVAAPLAVLVMMSLSKLVIAAATSLVRSTRGRNAFYVIVVLGFVLICQVPGLMAGTSGDAAAHEAAFGMHATASFDLSVFLPAARIFAWTPFGAAFQLPFDALLGAWGAFAGRLAVIAATVVLCFMGTTACLRHDRLTTGASSAAVTVKGLGAFGHTADSVSGAIAARLFTYLKRDPRQSLLFAMPVILVALMAVQSRGDTVTIWGGLVMGGWFMFIAEGNGLAYDGRGYAMEVICGVRGVDDRLGRVRLLATIAAVYIAVLAVGIFAFTGDWRDAEAFRMGRVFIGLAWGLAFCGLGAAEVLSVLLMYPVPPVDKPFSSPPGRAVAQGFFPFVQMLVTPLLMLPTGVAALVIALAGGFETNLYGLIWIVALANGIGMLALGTWLGGKLLEVRSLSVLHTLDEFASLQQ